MDYSVKCIYGKVKNARAAVAVPGSKSITARALLIAALADGRSTLYGAQLTGDCAEFISGLRSLGINVTVEGKTVTVEGCGGRLPVKDGAVYVGSAGTAARFLTALAAFSDGEYVFDSSNQMKRRPMAGLIQSLRQAGAEFTFMGEDNCFPFVVRGAKAHQTGFINSHEVIVMPTIAMGEDDKDYAISFSCPTDAEGIFMIVGRQSCDTRKLEGAEMDTGNPEFGGTEALVIFDNVFIPNERVFMCKEYQFAGENIYLNGEYEFAGVLVERFAGYHRQSYGGCKVGVGDVLIGAAALAADYNGCPKASHIKDKLIEMQHLNETLYACGIACSALGTKTASGNYLIDLLLANVCKQNVTRFPYEIVRLAEDIAGGLMVTAPSEKDLRDPKIGPYVEKYLRGVSSVSTENRLKVLRLIENLSLGTAAVGYRTESMHGAGSPQAQRIMISRQGNLRMKKQLAKAIAHIED